jgi:polygalacturonase
VHNVTYRNVCMRNVRNPLGFTPFYSDRPGELLPLFKDITLENVHILTKGSYTFLGLDAEHKLGVTFENVFADDLAHSTMIAKNADITIGSHAGNLEPTGEDVAVHRASSSSPGHPLDCEGRFIPFPTLPHAPEMAGAQPPVDKNPYVGPGAK